MDRSTTSTVARLVSRKMQAAQSGKAGCVPCFGAPGGRNAVCIPWVEKAAAKK